MPLQSTVLIEQRNGKIKKYIFRTRCVEICFVLIAFESMLLWLQLLLMERKLSEVHPLLTLCSTIVENWHGNPIQKESLRVFFLVLQVTHYLDAGQVRCQCTCWSGHTFILKYGLKCHSFYFEVWIEVPCILCVFALRGGSFSRKVQGLY